jgi:SpoVK/Ycf46/Vps4 family AAA+-type ATPase
MTQPPHKKPAYNKGGYGSGNRERNPPPKKVVPPPPPQNDLQIYVNPNDPNDFIFLDYSPAPPKALPTPSQSVFPFRPQYDYRDDDSEDEDLLKLRRIVKNDKALSNNRPPMKWIHPVEDIDDLLHLSYAVEKFNYTNISLNQAHLLQLQAPLQKLKDLIGMESIKTGIFNQLVFFLQNIEPQFPQMLHTCVQGPPGCGKTELANILADIYANLGIIREAKVVVARRSDLVAGFLGQTAIKTQEVIDSAKGGVLLIDEAYSLGNEEKKDSFAKECIDTINQNLTEGKADFICIIAGYKEDLEKSFFGFNSGLERRFPYRYTIDEYTPEDLCKIYQTILGRSGWKIKEDDEKKMVDFLRKERESFKFNGGDLENFVHFSKLAFAKNKIFKVGVNERVIQMDDVLVAFEMYGANKNKIVREVYAPPMFMYT